ncbi:hypothetical protein GOBAR_AA34346 [Gossypium barbadense]|uniref:Uncharacterized protein n=1 Tax=Gossypium barbadense TaxID=3634 RepID=A0A2P5W5K1_GOSBA|nr:hypothetical protein GOBAR_AA34346 [Gossypium barbadense]
MDGLMWFEDKFLNMFGVEKEKTSMMGDEGMVGGAKGPSFNGLGWYGHPKEGCPALANIKKGGVRDSFEAYRKNPTGSRFDSLTSLVEDNARIDEDRINVVAQSPIILEKNKGISKVGSLTKYWQLKVNT